MMAIPAAVSPTAVDPRASVVVDLVAVTLRTHVADLDAVIP